MALSTFTCRTVNVISVMIEPAHGSFYNKSSWEDCSESQVIPFELSHGLLLHQQGSLNITEW